MTTRRLFPATNGPAGPASYSGPFLCGVLFEVTAGGQWFDGYWLWVPGTDGDTVARKFALWCVTGNGQATLIPSATVTSGTLTAGQWNFVPLAEPVQLAIGTVYNACTGWEAVHGFPDSNTGTDAANCYGTGGHTAGITNGPLHAYSDITGGTSPDPYGNVQGVFSASLGTDPAVHAPFQGSDSANFWIDIQVDDTAPAGYAGSYRLWPNNVAANVDTVPDSAVNYVLATEFALAEPCTLDAIWYFSPAGTAQLATACDVWSIDGPGTGTRMAGNAAPSWSGAAGSGWISCAFGNAVLPAGIYKVSVYNSTSPADGWSAKDANSSYWGTGAGGSGITNGPLSAPGVAGASPAYVFDGSGGGNTPPFSDGSGTTEPGQCTFAQPTVAPGTDQYPYLYVDSLAQNYWVDIEVTPAAAASSGSVIPAWLAGVMT
ncbi:MAG TPA: hypothetical protein VFX70_08140 [Mycobacteriales bacterium]|nr:hypothetical protein [Mycobacteriales bacterium]